MGGYYVIAGQKVANHWLSIGTIGLFTLGIFAATGGNKDAKPRAGALPPINAASKEEEEFIRNFVMQAEKEEKEAKH
ncbi:uncharacterized protein VTP21DRAFT_988 [Calcarisporiella thermophila]|uniref:uncharacterized protein n=1 Tax=Calcarisporiella thermophila TaxID=911321 RepID=UPI003743BA19